jgi:hypothetical protein
MSLRWRKEQMDAVRVTAVRRSLWASRQLGRLSHHATPTPVVLAERERATADSVFCTPFTDCDDSATPLR